jgi:hypothetical protein
MGGLDYFLYIRAMEQGKEMGITEALNLLGESINNLRDLWLKENPGKQKEFDAKFNEMLNHSCNPLKQIQLANFNSKLPSCKL